MPNNSRAVYSTDGGRLCRACRQPTRQCRCKAALPQTDGFVRLQRQTKGRNGKPVVVITGVPLPDAGLKQLAKQLKVRCGVGGTAADGNIIIQGDKRDLIKTELESLGYKVKGG